MTDDFMQAVIDDRDGKTRVERAASRWIDALPGSTSAKLPSLPTSAAILACSSTTPSTVGTLQEHRAYQRLQPCSEYMYLDDSACNLASLNLMKFLKPEGTFNVESFRKAIDTVITSMEIIVGNASYPTEKIEKNSLAYRPLGLGYGQLGRHAHVSRGALRQ